MYTVSAKVEATALMWIANAGEDTVSKVDTEQNKETARYSTAFWKGGIGGNGTGLPNHGAWDGPAPSRSAVDFNGNAFIANRGFNRTAEVVKILSTGCIDRNGNGVCDTSQDYNNDGKITPDEMYPVIDDNGNGIIDDNEIRDERVVWIRRIGGHNEVARALTIDKDGFLWVGMYNTKRFYKMDPVTGADLGNWSVGVNPYGAVVDNQGRLFTAALGRAWSTRFDTADPANTQFNFWVDYGYGIALGRVNNVPYIVTAHHSNRGFSVYNPDTLARSFGPSTGYSAYGISFDSNGEIVFSGAYGQSTRGATKARLDGSIVWTRNAPAGCTLAGQRGAIVDANNDVWVVSVDNHRVCKYLADGTYGPQVVVGLRPYTYSDATGIGLQFTDPTGKITFVSQAPQFGYDWEGAEMCFQGGGNVSVQVAAADTEAGLEFANPAAMALTEVNGQLCGTVPAGVSGFFLAVEFTIKTGGTVVVQPSETGECTIDLPTGNEPPTAICIDAVTIAADDQCQAAAPGIDNGSSDPDGSEDIASLTQAPAAGSSLGLGEHTLGLTITDLAGESASCSTVVTVVDQSAPSVGCGMAADGYLPSSWPDDGPLVIDATGGDNCGGVTLAISNYSAISKKGKAKDTAASSDAGTLSIGSSGGVDTTHSWTVTATDAAGNVSTVDCTFTVGHPGNGDGGANGGCNNGGGNGAEGCSPSAQGNDDSDPAVNGGDEVIKNTQTIAPGNGKGKGK